VRIGEDTGNIVGLVLGLESLALCRRSRIAMDDRGREKAPNRTGFGAFDR
jgi:hypothetical protein